MAKSSATEIKLPDDAIAADEKIREQAARVKARIQEKMAAEGDVTDDHPVAKAAKSLKATAKKSVARNRKAAKKAPAKKAPAKKAATKRRRRKTKDPNESRRVTNGVRDVNYPKSFEEGVEHSAKVRAEKQRVTQCPPAKAGGIKTTAEVKQPKSEVEMKKATATTRKRKTTARKTTARKTTARRKTGARKTTARKTTARKTATRKTAATGGGRLGDFTNDQKITIDRAAKKDLPPVAASKYKVLKTGMTVGKALDALNGAGFKGRRAFLRKEREAGRITIK